jgi:hypothetical protein
MVISLIEIKITKEQQNLPCKRGPLRVNNTMCTTFSWLNAEGKRCGFFNAD